MKRLAFLLATAAVAAPLSFANAADIEVAPENQYYATLFGAWAFDGEHDFDFVSNASGARFDYDVSMEDGFLGGGALGWILSPNIRIEGELAIGHQKFGNDYVGSAPFTGAGENGSVTSYTMLGNVWFNADLNGFQPYIGGGVGGGIYDGDLSVTNGAGPQFSSSEFAPAFQLGAGVRYAFTNEMELDLSYRYRGALVEFGSDISGFKTEDGYLDSHSVQVGLTWKF